MSDWFNTSPATDQVMISPRTGKLLEKLIS